MYGTDFPPHLIPMLDCRSIRRLSGILGRLLPPLVLISVRFHYYEILREKSLLNSNCSFKGHKNGRGTKKLKRTRMIINF